MKRHTRQRVVAAELVESHDELADALAEASAAAVHLMLDPGNPDAPRQRRAARRLLQRALEHMDEEEEHRFLQAESAGLSHRIIARFCAEHDLLRQLARSVMPALAGAARFDDQEALLLLRFLRAFEAHVADEELAIARVLCGSHAASA